MFFLVKAIFFLAYMLIFIHGVFGGDELYQNKVRVQKGRAF